jgi:hypothetical protein
MGEALYCLISHILLTCNPTMASHDTAAYMGPHQYSISFPRGIKAPIHTIHKLCGLGHTCMVLLLDWANVYNSVDCVHTAHEVAARVPSFALFYVWSYHANSLLVLLVVFAAQGLPASILSEAGVCQGDVLGPLFFLLGVAPTINTLTKIKGCHPWAYLNNINVIIKQGLCPSAAQACMAAVFETMEWVGGQVGLCLNWAKCLLWAGDAEALVLYLGACATMMDGLKLLSVPVGMPWFVAEGLVHMEAKCAAMLECVVEVELPLQHCFLLLCQCVTQVPTFWACMVPGAVPALVLGDAVLLWCVGGFLGVPIELGLLQEWIAWLPMHLGGMGLHAVEDQAKCAFGALLLFAAMVVHEQVADFPCSVASVEWIAGLLLELVVAGLCHSPDSWCWSLNAGDFLCGVQQL